MVEHSKKTLKTKVLQFLHCAWCILVFLLGAWYWYYLALAVENEDWGYFVMYLISALFFHILGVVGFIGGFMEKRFVLLYYCVVMFIVALITLIQIIVYLVYLSYCDDNTEAKKDGHVFWYDICLLSNRDTEFWAPQFLGFLITLFAGVFAALLIKFLKDDEEEQLTFYDNEEEALTHK